MTLALALSASADAYNASQRLYDVFTAELLSETTVQDGQLDDAVQIIDAEFVWDGPPPDAPSGKDKKGKKQFNFKLFYEEVKSLETDEIVKIVKTKLNSEGINSY